MRTCFMPASWSRACAGGRTSPWCSPISTETNFGSADRDRGLRRPRRGSALRPSCRMLPIGSGLPAIPLRPCTDSRVLRPQRMVREATDSKRGSFRAARLLRCPSERAEEPPPAHRSDREGSRACFGTSACSWSATVQIEPPSLERAAARSGRVRRIPRPGRRRLAAARRGPRLRPAVALRAAGDRRPRGDGGRPAGRRVVGGRPSGDRSRRTTGYLVPPGDAELLAARIAELLGDRQLASTMGLRGREVAEEHRSERMAEGYARVYDGLTHRASPSASCAPCAGLLRCRTRENEAFDRRRRDRRCGDSRAACRARRLVRAVVRRRLRHASRVRSLPPQPDRSSATCVTPTATRSRARPCGSSDRGAGRRRTARGAMSCRRPRAGRWEAVAPGHARQHVALEPWPPGQGVRIDYALARTRIAAHPPVNSADRVIRGPDATGSRG